MIAVVVIDVAGTWRLVLVPSILGQLPSALAFFKMTSTCTHKYANIRYLDMQDEVVKGTHFPDLGLLDLILALAGNHLSIQILVEDSN